MQELDPHLLAAYDRDPTDMVLVGAMADDARELGLDDVAELLDALRENAWVPTALSGDWGWWHRKPATGICELAFNCCDPNCDRSRPSEQLKRLINGHLKAVANKNNEITISPPTKRS